MCGAQHRTRLTRWRGAPDRGRWEMPPQQRGWTVRWWAPAASLMAAPFLLEEMAVVDLLCHSGARAQAAPLGGGFSFLLFPGVGELGGGDNRHPASMIAVPSRLVCLLRESRLR